MLDRHQTCNSIYQLRLSVSVNTCHAENLAFSYLERYIVNRSLSMMSGFYSQILHFQNRFSRCHLRFIYDKVDLASNHHLRHLLFGCLCHLDSSDVFSFSQNTASICNFFDLIELMCDKDNGFSFCDQLLHHLHQFTDLLWCQNCCRLVKDQDIIVAVEHL